MNSNLNAMPGQCPKNARESQVNEHLSILQIEVERLEKSLVELAERLQPVLLQKQEVAAKAPSPPVPVLAPLPERIRNVASNVVVVRGRVAGILSDLEL